ncbi:MAG: leucine-rich repeat domain-containing protein [Candidatus Thorarchaeota archaeon]|nr:leucine-rich repeat domain-containing protein [Candidatus Thorarchaeota archaeon]
MEHLRLRVVFSNGETMSLQVSSTCVSLGGLGVREVDLSSMGDFSDLENVWLYNNRIDRLSLEPLSSAQMLRELSVARNQLKSLDLSPLSACVRLEVLDVSSNHLTELDLSPLSACRGLKVLKIGGNPLERIDLEPLADLRELRLLDMRGVGGGRTPLSVDLSPLFWCEQLEEMSVDDSVQLAADPSMRYSVWALMSEAHQTVSSHSERPDRPAARWLDSNTLRRIKWECYSERVHRLGLEEVIRRLRYILRHMPRILWFHTQKGMLEGLGLSCLSGCDCDPADLMPTDGDLSDFTVLVSEVKGRCLAQLRAQLIANGPTLFFRADELVLMRQFELASMLARRRSDEVMSLELPVFRDRVDVTALSLTEYGLSILDGLGLRTDTVSIEEFKLLRSALQEVGLEVRAREVPFAVDCMRSLVGPSASLARFVLTDRCHRLGPCICGSQGARSALREQMP